MLAGVFQRGRQGAGRLQRIRVDVLASIDGLRLFSAQDPASSIQDRKKPAKLAKRQTEMPENHPDRSGQGGDL
jgi:hypothetical protein